MMRSPTDLVSLETTAEERLSGIATIFAEALFRLKQRRIQACPNLENTAPEGLEVSPGTVLSVVHGG